MREITDTIEPSGKWHRRYLGLDQINASIVVRCKRLDEAKRESIINYLGFDWVCPSIYERKITPKWAEKYLKK